MGNSPSNEVRRNRTPPGTQTDYHDITWSSFLELIKELNRKCFRVRNEKGDYICFALDRTCADEILWKKKVRIKCFTVSLDSLQVTSSKILKLEEFLNVYNVHKDAIQDNSAQNVMCSSRYVLNETADSDGQCCICMDNNTEVLLPCLHSFCMACVAQELEFRPQFSCPICKTRIEHPIENSWEVADPPEPSDIVSYLSKLSGS